MPQLFQVLRCYKCSVFQVHQVKKSNKWQCKMCGDKQSIKRHYGIGNGKECRAHVQKLNGIRGEIDESSKCVESDDDEEEDCSVKDFTKEQPDNSKSKWSTYVENPEESKLEEESETMYLDNKEVVLEIPKKRLKRNATKPYRKKCNKKQEIVDDTVNENFLMLNDYKPEPNLPNVGVSYEQSIQKTKNLLLFVPPVLNVSTERNTLHRLNSDSLHEKNLKSYLKQNHDFATTVKLDNMQQKVYSTLDQMSKVPNSKWSEYVDEEVPENYEVENSDENTLNNDNEKTPNISTSEPSNKLHALFSLCDEDDLDNVLNF